MLGDVVAVTDDQGGAFRVAYVQALGRPIQYAEDLLHVELAEVGARRVTGDGTGALVRPSAIAVGPVHRFVRVYGVRAGECRPIGPYRQLVSHRVTELFAPLR